MQQMKTLFLSAQSIIKTCIGFLLTFSFQHSVSSTPVHSTETGTHQSRTFISHDRFFGQSDQQPGDEYFKEVVKRLARILNEVRFNQWVVMLSSQRNTINKMLNVIDRS